MAIIQLISDFQTGSYKIGLLHSRLLQSLKDVAIVDISHDVKLQNIVEASFIIKHIQIPDKQPSIVLVSVGLTNRQIIYQQQNNWYILPDNGLVSLLFDVKSSEKVFTIGNDKITEAIQLILDDNHHLLETVKDFVIKIQKKPMVHENMIVSERIFTDRHGNCYFNISKEQFENFFEPNHFMAKIQFVRDTSFYEICNHYNDVNPGDSLLMFSKIGFLKLSINQGNAAQLFRIKENSQIILTKI